MNKEEVLEKSRQANEDEGMEHAENDGHRIGLLAFMVLYIFLVVFDMVFGENKIYGAISSLLCVFLAGQCYAKYRFDKSKFYLNMTIGFGISSLIALAAYVINTLA